MRNRTDRFFYSIGKWIWLPLLIFGFWFSYGYFDMHMKDNVLYECKFRQATGLPCPGCGGTRAFVFLFKGDFIRSICYNPTVIYCFLAYIHFMILYFCRKNIKKNIDVKPIYIDRYIFIMCGVLLTQWIIKLLLIIIWMQRKLCSYIQS